MFVLAGIVLAAMSARGVEVPVKAAGLEGHWASDCQPIGKNGRHGVAIQITIKGERMRAEAQMYATNACQTPTFKLSYRGSIVFQRLADGSIVFDHMVRSIILTPQASDVVIQYNMEGDHGCGLQGWKINVQKSVAGKTCYPFSFPIEGTTLHDVAWLNGDALRLGAFPILWSNTVSAKRPTKPSSTVYHKVIGS